MISTPSTRKNSLFIYPHHWSTSNRVAASNIQKSSTIKPAPSPGKRTINPPLSEEDLPAWHTFNPYIRLTQPTGRPTQNRRYVPPKERTKPTQHNPLAHELTQDLSTIAIAFSPSVTGYQKIFAKPVPPLPIFHFTASALPTSPSPTVTETMQTE